MGTCPLVPRRRRAAVFFGGPLAIAWVTLACTSPAPAPTLAPEPSAPPVSDTGEIADGRQPKSGETLDPKTARDEALRILDSVAVARNLPKKGDVIIDVIGKQGIRKFAKEGMYEHTTPEELHLLGRIDSSLGVVPVGSDIEAIYLDLLEDGVLGLYDPKRKTLFIGDFVTSGMLSMVVGHEIAHGLQDMYFDLKALQEPMRHDSDAETARRYLIEGDAQAAYLAWVSGERGVAAIDDAVLDAMGDQTLELAGMASPYPVLARSLQLPYTDGTATIVRLVKQKGWKAIDELYANLPRTSEQMLHLDKLLANEPAIPTKLDAGALGNVLPELAFVWHDNIGEAALLAMLAEGNDATVARKAVAGWGGDAIVALDGKNGKLLAPVVAGVITWDTEADAKEFLPVFTRYLETQAASRTLSARKGKTVVFATGVPEGVDLRALTTAIWRGTLVGT